MLVSSSSSSLGSSLHFVAKSNSNAPSSSPARVIFRRLKLVAAYSTAASISRADMASPTSLYEVLGVPASATGHEIKAAYRKLARTCHPDLAAGNQRASSAAEFMKIHAAYSTLSDPDKRAVYDRDFFRLRHRFGSLSAAAAAMMVAVPVSSKSAYSGRPCRNWETDQCW
ncbi:hypothetical protein U1Q18_034735 [Sarracenia purpurea var. burkii]